jgi:hypothetical protein
MKSFRAKKIQTKEVKHIFFYKECYINRIIIFHFLGYWRKQVEHICQHVKAHAQNDAEFRALIGEPKMGKVINTFNHSNVE